MNIRYLTDSNCYEVLDLHLYSVNVYQMPANYIYKTINCNLGGMIMIKVTTDDSTESSSAYCVNQWAGHVSK